MGLAKWVGGPSNLELEVRKVTLAIAYCVVATLIFLVAAMTPKRGPL